MEDLTLLLLLKDRKSYSLRWLDYLSLNKCKLKIFIADGSKQEQNLNHYSFLLNSKYEYFGEDKNIQCFVKKILSSLNKINTEFVMMCSNDDFLILDNIETIFNKLKKSNCDCIKGRSLWFNLDFEEQLNGEIVNYSSFQTPIRSTEENISDRFLNMRGNYSGNWHAIIRRDLLLKIFSFILENQIFDLFVLETFFNLIIVIESKIITSNKIYLLNQDHLNRLSHDQKIMKYDLNNIRNDNFKNIIFKYIDTHLAINNSNKETIWQSIDNLFKFHFIKKKNIPFHISINNFSYLNKIKYFMIKIFGGSIFFKLYVKVKYKYIIKKKKEKNVSFIINDINKFLKMRKKLFNGVV